MGLAHRGVARVRADGVGVVVGKSRLTPEDIERMSQLRDRGYSYRMIGERYGVSERHAARKVKAWRQAREEKR